MTKNANSLYHGQRFPAAVIGRAVRWYFRFQLSQRDVEGLLFDHEQSVAGAISSVRVSRAA